MRSFQDDITTDESLVKEAEIKLEREEPDPEPVKDKKKR